MIVAICLAIPDGSHYLLVGVWCQPPARISSSTLGSPDVGAGQARVLAQDSIPIPRLVEAELRGDAGLHGAAIALLNHHEPAPAQT